MYAAPCIEISIYSTCKRISQKLLRNCMKFLQSIQDAEREPYMEFARRSMDEVEIIGNEGKGDYRKLNSYPSKVIACHFFCFQKSYSEKLLVSLMIFTY